MAESYCCFDHVVILVDEKDFDNPPSWLGENLHIIEGGEHTGAYAATTAPSVTESDQVGRVEIN